MITDDLKLFEGCRLQAYQDTLGVWTIGYGHTKGVKKGDTCTQSQADQWLKDDIEKATHDLVVALPWVSTLDSVRFDALVNMSFNLGITKLLTFNTFLGYMKAGKYAQAALDLAGTLWAKQVKGRAVFIATMIRTGVRPNAS